MDPFSFSAPPLSTSSYPSSFSSSPMRKTNTKNTPPKGGDHYSRHSNEQGRRKIGRKGTALPPQQSRDDPLRSLSSTALTHDKERGSEKENTGVDSSSRRTHAATTTTMAPSTTSSPRADPRYSRHSRHHPSFPLSHSSSFVLPCAKGTAFTNIFEAPTPLFHKGTNSAPLSQPWYPRYDRLVQAHHPPSPPDESPMVPVTLPSSSSPVLPLPPPFSTSHHDGRGKPTTLPPSAAEESECRKISSTEKKKKTTKEEERKVKKATEGKKNVEANAKGEEGGHSDGERRSEKKSEGGKEEEEQKKKVENDEGREMNRWRDEWKRIGHDVRHVAQMMEVLLFAFLERKRKKHDQRRRQEMSATQTAKTQTESEKNVVGADAEEGEEEEEKEKSGPHSRTCGLSLLSPLAETARTSARGGSSTTVMRCHSPPPPRRHPPVKMIPKTTKPTPRKETCSASSVSPPGRAGSSRLFHAEGLVKEISPRQDKKTSTDSVAVASSPPPRASVSPPSSSSSFFGACQPTRSSRRRRTGSGEPPATGTPSQEKAKRNDRGTKKKCVEVCGSVYSLYSSLRKEEDEEEDKPSPHVVVPPIASSFFVSSAFSSTASPAATAGGEEEGKDGGGNEKREESGRESVSNGACPTRSKSAAWTGGTPLVKGDDDWMKISMPVESAGLLLAHSQNKTALALYQEIYETQGIDDDDILFL